MIACCRHNPKLLVFFLPPDISVHCSTEDNCPAYYHCVINDCPLDSIPSFDRLDLKVQRNRQPVVRHLWSQFRLRLPITFQLTECHRMNCICENVKKSYCAQRSFPYHLPCMSPLSKSDLTSSTVSALCHGISMKK